ncbi:hypothetical protein [Goodfellowiella coeruleoviolacea]|uniref:LppX_LprAFG lipoprotein n=1 Tax=Goodfellowiella coeruleoviolacea TaxID=334858 RepID=A0AAE3GCV0_9PSEU|nr:hypothetical protein [Goodfellowiella coeruleoviolacea]MCP2164834.1 hypothetical protein [Goodfellowiella coeruleoviolacea]
MRAQQRLPRRRWSRPRWVLGVIGVVAATAVGVATFLIIGPGSAPTGPRPLTSDEANRLAMTRFRNYEAGGRAVTITVPTTAGGLVITGSVDYRAQLGYGVVHGTGRDTSSDGLIQWSTSTVFVHPMANAPAEAPAAPPGSDWHHRPLQTSGSSLDSSLLIALSLGSDRPDNAELLRQNGAAWVGSDQVADHQVDVMSGPAAAGRPSTAGNVRYWIDSDGTTHRVQADVASEPQPVVIDFDTRDYVPVQPAPGVTPTR